MGPLGVSRGVVGSGLRSEHNISLYDLDHSAYKSRGETWRSGLDN